MRIIRITAVIIACVTFLAARPAGATSLLLASPAGPALPPAATAGGDSRLPVLSGDGNYVLFASTAGNLAMTTNGTPFQVPLFDCLNVYLRNRSSNTTILVSVNGAGTAGGNFDSVPMGLSTNGQFALFETYATNLMAGTTSNVRNVLVRDLVNGTNILVSINTKGVAGNGDSSSSVMTPDGHYVAFTSAASDLVTGDTNGIPDVFVRDVQGGTTRLVSSGAQSTGSTALPSTSDAPAITPDGRYVAFYSSATNLLPGGTSAGEVYVRDLVGGATLWASSAARSLFKSATGSSNAVSCNPLLSANDQYVAFEACSNAAVTTTAPGLILRYGLATGLTDLVWTNAAVPLITYPDIQTLNLTPDGRFIVFVANVTNANTAIYLWDAQTGDTTLISASTNDTLSATSYCEAPVISTNGQYVAFLAGAPDLIANPGSNTYHIYWRDVAAGTTSLVDASTNGLPAGVDLTAAPALSDNGQSVVFESAQADLVPNDSNHDYDLFLRNVSASTTELISASQPLLPALAGNGFSTGAAQPISQEGRYLAFDSDADNLVPGDTNALRDVFVCDLYTGSNTLASVGLNGAGGSGISYEPAISGNGRYVAFTSAATNLIQNGASAFLNVFARDRQAGTNILVSANATQTGGGNGNSSAPAISSDGRYVLYASLANNLTAGSFTTGSNNLFLRDLRLGTNYALTTTGLVCSAMTSDGHFVAFTDGAGSAAGKVYLWNSQLARRVVTNTYTAGIQAVSVSPNGSRMAWFSGSSAVVLSVWNQASNQVSQIANGYSGSRAGLVFSADSRFLTYAASGSTTVRTNQVYRYDFLLQSSSLVSHMVGSPTAGNGSSDSPALSPDGRYVVYRSAAGNVVAGGTVGIPQAILFDTATGSNTLISPSSWGGAAANNRSLAPLFSGNGQTLVFRSWASDITGGDFNESGDLFAYEFLYAMIAPASGLGPTISWPFLPGQNYSVEYKNNLLDSTWLPAPGTITTNGNRASLTDSTPTWAGRFYRVVSGN